jgi:hypothetical protein
MATLSARKIHNLLNTARNGATTTKQGRSLEDLVCYIFGKIPGISISHRNPLNTFRSEEIDVALWNEKRSHILDFLPNVILVEAKNWSNPVGSSEVAWFDRKLQNRGLDFGILLALRGVTGNADEKTSAHQIIAQSLFERRRIVILTLDDIVNLRDTSLLVTLIKTRLCELAVTGTLFP